jgi:hypothetical protein
MKSMPDRSLLDLVPLWGVFLATVAVISIALEVGYRLGDHRRRRFQREDKPPLGEMVAATLGLVAFLLAFTFGLAAARFDLRRTLVLDESNAIGTVYLRTGLIPEPARSEARKVLREYVDLRLEPLTYARLPERLAKSEALHARLWNQAVAAGEKGQGNAVAALFIQSVNDLIDLHAKCLALGIRNRIPAAMWGALYLVAFIGRAVLVYHAGLAGTGRSIAALAVVVTFSAVIVLITDLDRPQEGLLRVDQYALVSVRDSMAAP